MILVDSGRTGTDKGHIALQHVPELGKFVQTGLADKVADALDDPGIVVHFEHHAVLDLVLSHELLLPLFRIHIHGAELVDLELPALLAHPDLGEEDGARGLDVDDGTKDDRQHHGDEAAHQTACNVNDPLQQGLAEGDGADGGGEHVIAEDIADDPVGQLLVGVFHKDVDGDAHIQQLLGQSQRFCGIIRQVDKDLVHHLRLDVVHKALPIGRHRHVADLLTHHGLIQNHQTKELVIADGGLGDGLDHTGGSLLGGSHHDLPGVLDLAVALAQVEFVVKPQDKAQGQVDQQEDHQQPPGKIRHQLQKIEQHDGDREDKQLHLSQRIQLLQVAPLQNTVVVIQQDADDDVGQRQQDKQLGELEGGHIHSIGGQKHRQQQGDHDGCRIHTDKVQMPQPAFPKHHRNNLFSCLGSVKSGAFFGNQLAKQLFFQKIEGLVLGDEGQAHIDGCACGDLQHQHKDQRQREPLDGQHHRGHDGGHP